MGGFEDVILKVLDLKGLAVLDTPRVFIACLSDMSEASWQRENSLMSRVCNQALLSCFTDEKVSSVESARLAQAKAKTILKEECFLADAHAEEVSRVLVRAVCSYKSLSFENKTEPGWVQTEESSRQSRARTETEANPLTERRQKRYVVPVQKPESEAKADSYQLSKERRRVVRNLILTSSFSITVGGYDVEDVDEYLDKLIDGLDTNGISVDDIRRASFSNDRKGYDAAEVDSFLESLCQLAEEERAKDKTNGQSEVPIPLEGESDDGRIAQVEKTKPTRLSSAHVMTQSYGQVAARIVDSAKKFLFAENIANQMNLSLEGRKLRNRYSIESAIGKGKTGVIYRGRDASLDKGLNTTVAIEVLAPPYSESPEFLETFGQMASLITQAKNRYITEVYDYGYDGDIAFIVTEDVPGADLKYAIDKRGAIDQRKVAEIGFMVCNALNAWHKLGFIHEDICSSNIMIRPDGYVSVLSFGVAQAKRAMRSVIPTVLGDARYVSPEQIMCDDLTPACDIYSLGIVLYEAATGKLPFVGADANTTLFMNVLDDPISPREINSVISSDLEEIIMRALSKHPPARFENVVEMRTALNDFLQKSR